VPPSCGRHDDVHAPKRIRQDLGGDAIVVGNQCARSSSLQVA
jgi:hypothetical protein